MPSTAAGGEERLTRAAVWSAPDRRLQSFIAQGSGFRFQKGEGLPGTAWLRHEPVWANPLSAAQEFTRGSLAAQAGLRAAVAIPVMARGEAVAVLSCYMADVRNRNTRLAQVAGGVAAQLGSCCCRSRPRRITETRRLSSQGRSRSRWMPSSPSTRPAHDAVQLGGRAHLRLQGGRSVGQPLDMLLPSHLRRRHATDIAQFATSAQTSRRMGERSAIVGRRKNGEIFPAEASISRYMAGGHWTFTVMLRDITDRQRTEEGLRFLSEVSSFLGDLIRIVRAPASGGAAVPTLGDLCHRSG